MLRHHKLVISVLFVREVREGSLAASFKTLEILGTWLQTSELRWEMFNIVRSVKLGSVGRSKRFALDFGPVDALKPGVAHDVFSVAFSTSKSLVWILLQ